MKRIYYKICINEDALNKISNFENLYKIHIYARKGYMHGTLLTDQKITEPTVGHIHYFLYDVSEADLTYLELISVKVEKVVNPTLNVMISLCEIQGVGCVPVSH